MSAAAFCERGKVIVGLEDACDHTRDDFPQTYSQSSRATIFGAYLGPTWPLNRRKTQIFAVFGDLEAPVFETPSLHGGLHCTKQPGPPP